MVSLHFFEAGSYHPTWGLVITGGQDSDMDASTLVDGLTEKNEIADYDEMKGMIISTCLILLFCTFSTFNHRKVTFQLKVNKGNKVC